MSKTLDLLDPINWDHPLNRGLVFWFIPHPYYMRGQSIANVVDVHNVLASFLLSPVTILPYFNRLHSSFYLLDCISFLDSIGSSPAKDMAGLIMDNKTNLTFFLSNAPDINIDKEGAIFRLATSTGNVFWFDMLTVSGSYANGVRIVMNVSVNTTFRMEIPTSNPLSPSFDTFAATVRNGAWSNSVFYENGEVKSGTTQSGDSTQVVTGPVTSNRISVARKSPFLDMRLNVDYFSSEEIAALHEENMKGYPNLLRWLTGRAYFLPLDETPLGSGLLLAGKRNSLISPSIVV